MKVWTYLEYRGHRAHFLEEVRPGWILVEFINGEQEEWPLAECRELGLPDKSYRSEVTETNIKPIITG